AFWGDRLGWPVLLPGGRQFGVCVASFGAASGRGWRGHAASDRFGAGDARVQRGALAQGLRCLQFRRRRRQSPIARDGNKLVADPAVAAGLHTAWARRHRGGDADCRSDPKVAPEPHPPSAELALGERGEGDTARQFGFRILVLFGITDSVVRGSFLVCLPFLLIGKGAAVTTAGFALTLVFIGGAAGKLACGWIGNWLGTAQPSPFARRSPQWELRWSCCCR